MIRFAGFSYFCIYEAHLLDHKYCKTDCKIQIAVKKNSNIVDAFSINRHSLQYRLFTQFFGDLSKAVGTTLPPSIPKFQSYVREWDGNFECFWSFGLCVVTILNFLSKNIFYLLLQAMYNLSCVVPCVDITCVGHFLIYA